MADHCSARCERQLPAVAEDVQGCCDEQHTRASTAHWRFSFSPFANRQASNNGVIGPRTDSHLRPHSPRALSWPRALPRPVLWARSLSFPPISHSRCLTPFPGATPMSVLVQQPAPDFKAQAVMPSKEFKQISLSDYRGKYVLLFFWPLDFTFVCPTEIIAFSDRNEEFAKLGVQILGVSVDSHFTHLAWQNTPRIDGGIGEIGYPMIADVSREISRAYDGLLPSGIALRGLFLIDQKGVVRHQVVNDLPLGRSVDEALRMVKALQFFEKNGEVCPANWKEGSATMKATPNGSKR